MHSNVSLQLITMLLVFFPETAPSIELPYIRLAEYLSIQLKSRIPPVATDCHENHGG